MRVAMTLMVRDEADVIVAMLEHHARQGVDVFIVTDNGSIDGTRELIEKFALDHEVDVRVDPVHRKQQSSLVTGMARDAATMHGADWVLNADADEFWVPTKSRSVRESLAAVPAGLQVFQVPVIDLTGEPAYEGTGLDRLIWRDARPIRDLHAVGLGAHSSPNAVHRGDPHIVVAQGNHEVNRPAGNVPDEPDGIEVLHLPWRSWTQFRHKVENAGRAYDANPDLAPSSNHHGMRDYRRLREGSLLAAYVARHPSTQDVQEGAETGRFVLDMQLSQSDLHRIPDLPLRKDVDVLRAQGRALVRREQRMIEEWDAAP